jgi:hypothetical protein
METENNSFGSVEEERSVQEEYPVKFEVKYPEQSSRILALIGIPWFFIKTIALLPHLIIIAILNIASGLAVWLSFWAILFTGKYPKSFFDFIVGATRWQIRVNAWMFSLTDKYPPFALK